MNFNSYRDIRGVIKKITVIFKYPRFISRIRDLHHNEIWKKIFIRELPLSRFLTKTLMVFSFLPNNVHFISKNAISCLFLKNVSPSKRVIGFILNNLHFPMVEGIAFYALHKSRVLIIPCKADGFCLFQNISSAIASQQISNKNSNGVFFSTK